LPNEWDVNAQGGKDIGVKEGGELIMSGTDSTVGRLQFDVCDVDRFRYQYTKNFELYMAWWCHGVHMTYMNCIRVDHDSSGGERNSPGNKRDARLERGAWQ
jgi:hypothetical protein